MNRSRRRLVIIHRTNTSFRANFRLGDHLRYVAKKSLVRSVNDSRDLRNTVKQRMHRVDAMTYQTPNSSPKTASASMMDHDRGSLRRYVVLSAISGCIWAVIAYFLGSQGMGSIIAGGLLASPLIGIGVSLIYRSAYCRSAVARVGMSLVTLYVATALFGMAAGLYDAMRPIPNRLLGEVVLQSVMATLWGVTFTGFFLFLWPLSFVNHWLIGRVSCYSLHRRATTPS